MIFRRKPIDDGGADATTGLPSDWRKFHLDNVKTLDPKLVASAVDFIATSIIPDLEWDTVVLRIRNDPEWWVSNHFFSMMSVRNSLRKAGFGEKEFKIDNLDDYAVGLVELALGVTKL